MISTASSPTDANARSVPPIVVFLTWLVVLIPLAWGVYNTVKTSTNLFIDSPPTQTAPQTGAAH